MTMSELSSALADFFHGVWPHDAPAREPGDLAENGWSQLRDLGLHLVGVDEQAGGSGGTFEDLMAVATLTGRHAADVPAIESGTAAWACARAGLQVEPDLSLSIPLGPGQISIGADGTLTGTAAHVPWGAWVDRVVALADDGTTVVFRPADTSITHGRDLAGQPRDTLTLATVTPVATGLGVSPEELRRRTVALRVAQIAGALQAVADLTRRYVGERVQFGKPIGSFQAVQAHVVELQQMAVMTTSVADRLALAPSLVDLEVTSALVVASENALTAAAAAHQAHGAIGMTREYRLHLLTRRLHTWSGDVGEALDLSAELGGLASRESSFARLILDDPHTEDAS